MELLLDTMCNTFGGIVLIAILVALLSQTAGPKTPDQHITKETSEMLVRKIRSAQSDLDEAMRGIVPNDSRSTKVLSELILKKHKLAELLSAQEEILAINQNLTQIEAKKSTMDLSHEFKRIKSQLALMNQECERIENSIKTMTENSDRLTKRSSAIAAQIQDHRAKRVAKLRFPKEHHKTKQILNVILRYSRAYPFMTGPDENNSDILWSDRGTYMLAEPNRSAGLSIDTRNSDMLRTFQRFRTDVYQIAIHVYPDSLDEFRQFRDLVVQMGFDYGWDPMNPDITYKWGSEGTSPPPL